MKEFLLITAAVFAFSAGSASAADLAKPVYKAAPPPAPVYSWTGFYLGAGFGYGMYNADHVTRDDVTGVSTVNTTAGGRGYFGTVLVGGDYQFSDRVVAGVFADYDFSRIKGDYQPAGFGVVGEMKQTSAWAVGGRIGWLATPQILTYVNGGYTQARFSDVNLTNIFGGPVVGSLAAQTYSGYFIGGGVEYMFAPGWFAKTEYRYADYSSRDIQIINAAGLPIGFSERIHPYVQTIRSELVYKFNFGGPVVAKY